VSPETSVEQDGPVRRLQPTPIVEAGSVPGYEALFNAGLLHHDGRFHLFVRAVHCGYRRARSGGPRFIDYRSDIVVMTSTNGISYHDPYVLAPAGTAGAFCFEDPRVQRIHAADGIHTVMTYTHLMAPSGPWRIGAHRLDWHDGRFRLDSTSARLLGPADVPNKDAVMFSLTGGQVALIHRIQPNMQLAVFDDFDHAWNSSAAYWNAHVADLDRHVLLRPARHALGIGAGAPPVRCDEGLLLFFHERRHDGSYTMNVALLDEVSGRVRARLEEPVLEPVLQWERVGDVDEVIFVQGAHADEIGDDVYLTYGAADRCVGAAVASKRHLLDLLNVPPRNHAAA
jgi:predicted GH43/DUF377 family glycosyl hydrolase